MVDTRSHLVLSSPWADPAQKHGGCRVSQAEQGGQGSQGTARLKRAHLAAPSQGRSLLTSLVLIISFVRSIVCLLIKVGFLTWENKKHKTRIKVSSEVL